MKKVPVTILTGFLGAGKTTFLNYILKEHHGKRIAVIQNEFGPDVELTEQTLTIEKDGKKEPITAVSMSNGCICCAVKDDLLVTVENLVKAKDQFDYIFIECSGLAEPGSVASVFWVDEELESDVFLDGIVTLVDAKHILQHLSENKKDGSINEAYRQIAFADRILLNKKDLVSLEYLEQVQQQIKEINAITPIYITERSQVSLDNILNINAFDFKKALEIDPHLGSSCRECMEKNHSHSHHSHDKSVSTVTMTQLGQVDLHRFNSWLGNILWDEDNATEIFRCKGIISVMGEKEKYLLQGVHTLFEVEPSGIFWSENEPRENKLVFIGRNLGIDALTSSFQKECLVDIQ